MSRERISWIDVARGIGILLVLYGHALNGNSYRHIIYAFHMPLFFFLSGIVYHHKRQEHFLPFLKKNIKAILLPYLLFAFLTYVLWMINRGQIPPVSHMIQHTYGVLYGNSSNLFFNTILWFLPCLFATRVLFELLTRISEKKAFISASLLFFATAGYISSIMYPTARLPFGTETALTAIVFFGTGYLWNRYNEIITTHIKPFLFPLFIFSLLLLIIVASLNYNINTLQVDMRLNRLHNVFYFYIASFSGIFASIVLSMKIQSNKILEYLGKHSLILFVWHNFVFSYITLFLLNFIPQQILSTHKNTYIAPIYTILATLIILILNKLYQHARTALIPK